MLKRIFYIVYLALETPGRKRRISRKQAAKNSFTILIGYYSQFPLWFLWFILYYYFGLYSSDFFIVLCALTFLFVALPISFILFKSYTYDIIHDIEISFQHSLKVWQAKVLYAIFVLIGISITFCFFIFAAKMAKEKDASIVGYVSELLI